MAMPHSQRLTTPRTGIYFGIFASAFVCLFLGGLIAEQLGVDASLLNSVLFAAPLALFVGIGAAAPADDGREFFTAGRSMPSYFSGLSLAVTTLGGVGVVSVTGALFKIGIDALPLQIGWLSGLVVAGVMLFPFLRKCGAYTIPSFLGLRFESRVVRMIAAMVLIVPTLMLLAAEVRIGAFMAAWMTGTPEALMVVVIAVAAAAAAVMGGLRGATWASATQAIVALIAMAVPATIVSLLISNLPLPQMMHGNLLRALSRQELAQPYTAHAVSAIVFDMPGAGLEAFTNHYLQSFGHVGRLSLPFVILTIATGIAGLPSVLQRAGTTPSVYETRKAMGWAVLTMAFMVLTLASVAGFMRGYVVEQIVNAAGDRLPLWFQTLQQYGLADAVKTRASITLDAVFMRRDVAFGALPMAAGMPLTLVALAMAGAIAAALAGAAAQTVALAGMLSEDIMHGAHREPPEDVVRLRSVRVAIGVACGFGIVGAYLVTDPLAVALAALALSAATGFPVLVLSILWRRVSRSGAVAGLVTGFAVTAVLMLASVSGLISLPLLLAAAFGGPANFAVMALLSQAAPNTSRRALEVVRDLRLPGGEAIYDRDMRILRRKRATSQI